MSVTDYNNMLAQQAMGQYASTTTTSTAYPGMGTIIGPSFNPYPVPPPQFPHEQAVTGLVGVFRVRRLENGYLVECQKTTGGTIAEYYAETLKDVGERVAAMGVAQALEGGQP
jgi:hypothetical protein